MEKTKIVYRITTILVCLAMVFSSYSDLYSDAVKQAFVLLGFPGYFRIELGIMKIAGIITLIAPLPYFLKEWAYAGFLITFVSACIAHTVSGDPVSNRIAPLFILILLLMSYAGFRYQVNRTGTKHLIRL